MTAALSPAPLAEIEAAAKRLRGLGPPSPLEPLHLPEAPAEIFLKLENLQPVGCFKARPVGNVMRSLPAAALADGVFTATSGNTGIALAYVAAQMGVPARIICTGLPAAKRARIAEWGAEIIDVPFETWWPVIATQHTDLAPGVFIDAVGCPEAVAGDATIGREIIEALGDVDTIVAPFGGGGLTGGIGSALRAMGHPARLIAVETEAATPLRAAFDAGEPVTVPRRDCFVTGIGAATVLDRIWPLARTVIDGVAVVSLRQVADAVRLLFERKRVVAEGAGAAALAAILAGQVPGRRIACLVCGGNIDTGDMATILAGGVPGERG